ncbi:hypothetical protein QF028_004400 [Neobacillus sp. B4I6]|uniref:helix-turn-helix domain-containing protein n=1 Tax=Neobacillus sp. B4I6 TaxID=3373925 RepID=UPI003D23239E
MLNNKKAPMRQHWEPEQYFLIRSISHSASFIQEGEKMERDFKGVWIPKDIWLSEDLGWTEKFLLTEIDSLAKNNECFASNDYFAKFFNISKDRISKIISSLSKKGYLEVHLIYKEGTKQVEKRVITTIGYQRKHLEGIGENNYTPIGENNEDINTSIINPIINSKDIYTQYAEFVKMKESEYNKLVEVHGEPLTKKMIEVLDNYKGANGKKYKSDYRAILNWVVDKVKGEKNERTKQGGRKPNSSEYDSLSL